MPIETKQQTPQEVLMNCLADAERINKVLVIVYTKDEIYEHWSNGLPSHEKLGLIELVKDRINIRIKALPEIDEDAS